ncbi:MAG: NADH-quinone oxidoreductase subunit M [Cocleimonas sp.]|nr:NADH-quinone oxidoreductase subunit M [Cocleimonas sp.]
MIKETMIQFSEIQASWPLLEALQLLPFAAALILWHIRGKPAAIFGLLIAILEMLLALQLYHQFDLNTDSMQFANQVNLFGLSYHVAVDGISILFVLLTALLSLLGVLFIIFRQLHRTGVLAIMALIQALLMSQFVTVDLLWFVLMSILEIIAMGYLLYRWATFIDAQPMIIRYSQFMTVGILLMLVGTFMLGWNYSGQHSGNWSFDLYKLASTPIEPAIATFIFFSLFYGLGIRIPTFPLHGWLPATIEHGNVAVAPMFLLGLKVGVFGLLRFVFPIMPETVIAWHKIVIIFAVIGIFYAALLAIRQVNLRRLMAYAVISHTGILTIGLFTLHKEGFAGGIMLAINFGLAISGLMFMIGLVWQRTNTASIERLGGVFQYMPMVSIAFLISGLAIAGMPGTPGFDAVHLVLESSISEFGALVTIAAALGNVVAAGFLLFAFQKAFLAKPSGDTSRWDTSPARLTERAMAIIVIVVILAMGFFSELWLSLFDHSLNSLSAVYEQLLNKQGGH